MEDDSGDDSWTQDSLDGDTFYVPVNSNLDLTLAGVTGVRQMLRTILNNTMAPSTNIHEERPPKVPKIKAKPNTEDLDVSRFSQITKHSAGLDEPKRKKLKEHNVVKMVMTREAGVYDTMGFPRGKKCQITNQYVPNHMEYLNSYPSKVFCGVFTKDGDRFVSAAQDRCIRIYNSTTYKLQHLIVATDVDWSIMDISIRPKTEQFVYSTWSNRVYLCSLNKDSDYQEGLTFSRSTDTFCIFSVAFSADGKELVGGGSDGCLYLYDLEQHTRSLKVTTHRATHVNNVGYIDESSHILCTGGDDGLLKLWDKRTLTENSPKPVGVFGGHMGGITFIDPKGDGRHLISNSKDQSIKLWDIRVVSGPRAAHNTRAAVKLFAWDYRWNSVPHGLFSANKIDGDKSIMTYRGHIVNRTLIRCRFSPLHTTGQRYIYTGCGSGSLVIYDALTGHMVSVEKGRKHDSCVRDVHWHPFRNEIISSAWDGFIGKWTYDGNMDDNV